MTTPDTPRRHTRDDVACAALRVLDDVGLPDLTMRRLAATLDVQPSALYHHFADKQTMLAAVADLIVGVRAGGRTHTPAGAGPGPASAAPGSAPVSGSWTDAVRDAASILRDRLLAYRDGAEVVASALSLGLGADAAVQGLASAIAGGGFSATVTGRAATALLHFVLGHVWHEQQRLQFDSLGVVRRPAAGGTAGDRPDAAADDEDPTAAFGFGVDLIIDGLRARREAGPAARAPRHMGRCVPASASGACGVSPAATNAR